MVIIGRDQPFVSIILLAALRFYGQAGSLVQIVVDQTSNNCMDPYFELIDPVGSLEYSEYCAPNCFGSFDRSCTTEETLTLASTGEYTLIISDAGADETGTCNVSVNCLLGCPPFTSTTVRNGSGVNASCFSPACPAVIGGNWCAKVDASGNPGARLTSINFYASPHPGLPSPYGEILVDLTSASYCRSTRALVPPATENTHCMAVPASAALVGFAFSSQAFSAGPGPTIQLCNAIDYVVGY